MKRTILIAVDVVDDSKSENGHRGYWHVAEVRSVIWNQDKYPTQSLDLMGLGPGQNEVEPDDSDSFSDGNLYDIPLPDAKQKKSQVQGLSLQMSFW